MIWQPYTEAVLELLQEICRSDRHVWRSRVPLICFDAVEFHYPDRVMRQFMFVQRILAAVDTSDGLHKKDRRAQSNWMVVHSSHVQEWGCREELVVQCTYAVGWLIPTHRRVHGMVSSYYQAYH